MSIGRKFLEEFIEIYRNEPSLWKVQSKEYQDRDKKQEAYEQLVRKLKEVDPTANKNLVAKKINSLRTTYRKEYNKVKDSKERSTNGEVYQPKLWYFPLLSFLSDHNIPRTGRSTTNLDSRELTKKTIETINGKIDTEVVSDIDKSTILNRKDQSLRSKRNQMASTTRNNRKTKKRRQQSPPMVILPTSHKLEIASPKVETIIVEDVEEFDGISDQYEKIKEILSYAAKQDDLFDTYAKVVAMKLRGLPRDQQLIAEKIMNETLFEAQLGNLTFDHKLYYMPGIAQSESTSLMHMNYSHNGRKNFI